MSAAAEPVVVALLPGGPLPRAARLADVVVTITGGDPTRVGASLLTACPGIALAVVGTPAGDVTVGVRNGPPLDLGQVTPPGLLTVGLLAVTAGLLHTRWIAGTLHHRRTPPDALRLARAAARLVEQAEHVGQPGRADPGEDVGRLPILLPCGLVVAAPPGDAAEQHHRLCPLTVRPEVGHPAHRLGGTALCGGQVTEPEVASASPDSTRAALYGSTSDSPAKTSPASTNSGSASAGRPVLVSSMPRLRQDRPTLRTSGSARRPASTRAYASAACSSRPVSA
ncbi:hypothetical protein ABUL04_28480 [Micromonospora harpali]|uniref:Uncharacterized protein n=1 Tax=Micromonospora harpali TaxID=1490225 RepID=A0ABW1HJT2_9ACTN